MCCVVRKFLGMLSTGSWSTLGILWQTVGGRIRVGMLRLRGRLLLLLLLLVMLLMYNARRTRMLNMLWRRRALLRVVRMLMLHGGKLSAMVLSPYDERDCKIVMTIGKASWIAMFILTLDV